MKALALSGSPFFFLSPTNKKLRWFFVVKYYCFRVHYTHSTSNFWAGCYIHNTRLKVFYGSCVTETFTRWVTFFRGKSCWNWWWWCYCLSFCTGIYYVPDHIHRDGSSQIMFKSWILMSITIWEINFIAPRKIEQLLKIIYNSIMILVFHIL